MFCYGESKSEHKMVLTLFVQTQSLVCPGLWITCLLALNKLKWKLVAYSHSILIFVFGSALDSLDDFKSRYSYLEANMVSW